MKSHRIKNLEDYIVKNESVTLDKLCEVFDVSKNTIRRDVKELLENGSIKKTMVIELHEEIKCSLDNENKRNISYDKVKGFIETDNLIVLLFDGNLLLPLKKDSFTVGNYEECKKFLLKKINK